MKAFIKILNLVFCLAFLVFAYLNLNDPDPLVWVSIYLYAAIFCGLAAFGRFYPKAYGVGIAVYLVMAVQRFFAQNGVLDWITKHDMQDIAATMQASNPWVENTREFFGLIIVAAALLLNYLVFKNKNKKKIE